MTLDKPSLQSYFQKLLDKLERDRQRATTSFTYASASAEIELVRKIIKDLEL